MHGAGSREGFRVGTNISHAIVYDADMAKVELSYDKNGFRMPRSVKVRRARTVREYLKMWREGKSCWRERRPTTGKRRHAKRAFGALVGISVRHRPRRPRRPCRALRTSKHSSGVDHAHCVCVTCLQSIAVPRPTDPGLGPLPHYRGYGTRSAPTLCWYVLMQPTE